MVLSVRVRKQEGQATSLYKTSQILKRLSEMCTLHVLGLNPFVSFFFAFALSESWGFMALTLFVVGWQVSDYGRL